MEILEDQIKIIKFGNIGKSLGTRNLASKLRDDIIQDMLSNEKIVFDFDGVHLVTNSFANECFAKLAIIVSMEKFKQKFAFINANDIVQQVIISSF